MLLLKIDLVSTPEIQYLALRMTMMTKRYTNKRNLSQLLSSLREGPLKIYRIIHSMQARIQNFSIRGSLRLRNKIGQKTPLAIKPTKLNKLHKGAVTVRTSSNRKNQ